MGEFKEKGITIVFVSHSIETVRAFCERVIYLQHGGVVYDGEVNKGLTKYQQEG